MKPTTLFLVLAALITPLVAEEPVFRPLFNGTDLTGWKGKGYIVEDATIVCTRKGGNLVTEETFTNYILEFEFKMEPGTNNGLGIHYPGQGDGAFTGMELQILDNTAPKFAKIRDYQYHGSLYSMQAAKREGLKPVGEWNHQRVTVNGPVVTVVLNGIEILNANLDEHEKAHPKHEGVKRREGHIALLGHRSIVTFRNIRIAELKDK